ncbi:hypothetical protein N9J84_01650 [Porticoccaceae bacterium]|nr:hypothetical protein [Porticoccaceae bacterium]
MTTMAISKSANGNMYGSHPNGDYLPPPPAIQRAIWPIPAYKGYDHITTTSITMNAIDVNSATGEFPFMLMASAKNVTCVGTRDYGSGAVYPYMHLQHKWNLTKLGGGAVPHGDAIKSPWTDLPVNPYVNRHSGEFTAVIHEPGTYVLELESSSPQHTASTTINITVNEPTHTHQWFDGLNGDDANDGNDPWGFACTNANYTESTGQLTETGKFTSYDHAAATGGQLPVDNYNWIYLGVTHGWRRITSKVSNDTIVIEPKIGSDQTGITSSTGAKQTFTGMPQNAPWNDVMAHLRGNNGATTYTLTESVHFRVQAANNDVRRSVVGYDTDADGVDVVPTVGMEGVFAEGVLSLRVNSGGNLAARSSAHNIDINCNALFVPYIGGTIFDDTDTVTTHLLFDRVKGANNSFGRATRISSSQAAKPMQYAMWGCDFENFKVKTYDSGAHDGAADASVLTDTSKSWTVNEHVGRIIHNLTDESIGEITANTATTITATLETGTDDNWDVGDTYEIKEPKNQVLLGEVINATDSRMALVGTKFSGECDDPVLDHYVYPSGAHDHVDIGYTLCTEGKRYNYCFNMDADDAAARNYVSVCDNHGEGDVNWFIDGSNSSNNQTNGHFMNYLIARNSVEPNLGFMFSYSARRMTGLDNVQFNATRLMFTNSGSSHVDQDQVISRNRSYGTDAGISQHRQAQLAEVVDNWGHDLATNAQLIEYDSTAIPPLIYDGNQIFAPNDGNSTYFREWNTSSNKTLAEFNTISGYTQTYADPNWTDPANGDFN